MTKYNIKAILFASLIVAMVLPFSAMNFAEATPNEKANENARDKTKELKEHRKNLDKKVEQYKDHMEKFIELKEKIAKAEKSNQSSNSLKTELDEENTRWSIIADEHKAKNSIPEAKLQKMMAQQEEFGEKLVASDLTQYVTGFGIDLATKEIQVGLDVSTVNSNNKNQVIDSLEELMPKSAKWHLVDSTRASFDSCTNEKYCVPLLGGNMIDTENIIACSNGFKATLGGIFGFVTAGHCVDGDVGIDVDDYNGDKLGVVHKETLSWGTDCDCAFIKANSSETDNKTLLSTSSSITVASYTSASSQNGDFIYKSGQTDNGLKYGVVTALNQYNFGYDPSIGWFYVTGLVASTAYSTGGDSGGSVMGGSQSNSLYGIIEGGNGSTYYHTPTDKIISKLGIAPVM